MNINNIWAGLFGFVMAMALTYLTWTPMTSFLDGITAEITELGVFLKVVYILFVFIVCVMTPINLATSDDKGEN